ncbi:MAG TPA: TIR domain-containing protein [Solirubrobacterales bacterium]|nr:TIR domain-containing protein [Solirubrobacterales bacterium]
MPTDRGESPTAFISYAHADRAAAHEIAFGLQKRGCEVWIDQGELSVGDSLIGRLAGAISEVDFVIALISTNSVGSSWCQRELGLAVTREIEQRFGVRRVLPLRLGNVEMPEVLADKVFLEVSDAAPGAIVPKLWEDIGKHARSASETRQPAPALDVAEAAFRRGRNLYDKGELTAARRHLNEAAQANHQGAALLLGEILYDQGELKKAAREWEFAATSDDAAIAGAAVIQYGRLLAELEFTSSGPLSGARGPLIGGHEVETAARMWRTAAESGRPGSAWAWTGLGRLWEDRMEPGISSDLAEAERAFEQAARSGETESHPYSLFKLGCVRWKLKKSREAIAVLDMVARGDDREWAPYAAFNLGRIHWEAGDDGEAAYWWGEAATADHPRISDPAREALNDRNSIWRLR